MYADDGRVLFHGIIHQDTRTGAIPRQVTNGIGQGIKERADEVAKFPERAASSIKRRPRAWKTSFLEDIFARLDRIFLSRHEIPRTVQMDTN